MLRGESIWSLTGEFLDTLNGASQYIQGVRIICNFMPKLLHVILSKTLHGQHLNGVRFAEDPNPHLKLLLKYEILGISLGIKSSKFYILVRMFSSKFCTLI